MITVIMSVYNNIAYLREAIEGILGQTYGDFEFFVKDDGSTEPVFDIITEYAKKDKRIIPSRGKNVGYANNINQFMKLGRGDYITIQDCDDVSLPDRFEKQLKLFKPGVGLVTTWGIATNESGKRKADFYMDEAQRRSKGEILENIKKDCWLLLGSCMWTREVYEKIGKVDTEMKIAQVYNYILRILKYFDMEIVTKSLYKHRKHKHSVRKIDNNSRDWMKYGQERADKCTVIK